MPKPKYKYAVLNEMQPGKNLGFFNEACMLKELKKDIRALEKGKESKKSKASYLIYEGIFFTAENQICETYESALKNALQGMVTSLTTSPYYLVNKSDAVIIVKYEVVSIKDNKRQ